MAKYDRIIDGRTFESAAPIRVTRAMIEAFCAAVGETNPLFTAAASAADEPDRALVAPPSFAAIFGDGENIFSHYPELNEFNSRRLLAGIDAEYLAPIRAGDSITIVSRLQAVYEKTGRSGPMIFVVIGSLLRKHDGEVAVRIEHRFTNPL
ncbi:MAG TPA: MaoC family dehydratase N-terminal domain-containing protein [Candidatus Binataceae bacterium]|nr:MaoC family dehydratase N-terminal domain-containing protein [Candidatus Binataceae bacterium]